MLTCISQAKTGDSLLYVGGLDVFFTSTVLS